MFCWAWHALVVCPILIIAAYNVRLQLCGLSAQHFLLKSGCQPGTLFGSALERMSELKQGGAYQARCLAIPVLFVCQLM